MREPFGSHNATVDHGQDRAVFDGVRGDVFPIVALAKELAIRGHEVVLCVPDELHPLFENEAFECADSDSGDLTPSRLERYGAHTARWGRLLMGTMMLRLYVKQLTIPRLGALHKAIDQALEGADLLVTHPTAALVGRIAAEQRGIPWITADLFPMLTPTVDHPPPGMPTWKGNKRFAGRYHRLAWRMATARPVRWMSGEGDFAKFRLECGLPTPRGYAVHGRLSPLQNVALVSAHYFEPASDWGPEYSMCGFTFWTGTDQRLSDELSAFLDQDDRAVLVTFGTCAAAGDAGVFERIARALDDLGLRGLFLTSNESNARGLGARAGVWPYAPLEAVLPRVRAVVHSGSHGTNALALAAGKPSVVIPHLFDQEWHGHRQRELGTGLMVAGRIRRDQRIRKAISRVIDEPHFAAAARSFQAKLETEDGAATACDLIEESLMRAQSRL